ncbi:uPF0182 protein Csac_0864 [Clostridium sp. CAG:356]|nr:uPF0182 protein Csac_0864 [Clostridium sp. CAG:356]
MEKNKLRISKKMRAIIVIIFIAIYALGTYVSLRGQYLEYVELGEQYVEKFFTDIKYKYSIMGITFVLLSIILYFTNKGIKKGLKPFFEQEKREVPKLPNKSITLIVAAIVSVIVSNDLVDKVLLFVSNASFGKTDIIFNLDMSYYMFIKPLVEALLSDFVKMMIALSAYMAGYYIIIFNFYFKAVDRELLRKSKLIKKLLRNAIIVSIGMALQNALNTQNIVTGKFLTLSNGTELTGAGVIESTIQLWGYLILSVIIVIAVIISVKFFAQNKMKKIVYPVAVVPIYLVALFLVMVGYDCIFVKSNEFDKERKYISENIKSTQEAYNIKVKETSIDYSGTIKEDEVEKNDDVIDNITIVNKNLVKKSLKDTQTETGYYIYNSVSLAKYNINGKDQLTYVAPREAENNTISYNNKTYEYTHGMGQIIASATSVTEDGNVEYLQKDISGSDNILEVKEPRIYYGVETNSVAVTNTKNKSEYDYTDSDGVEHVNNYDGNSGIQVGFWDRLILAVKNKDIRLAMTSSISSESKILTNRNIVKRAKAVLPNLIYDENPYTVVDDGKIYWVLDAYTVSDKYPYSTYTEVEYDGAKRNINYIRNSVKVIINAYDGEMTFYITDRNDPVIMAYLKLYPTIFSDYSGKEIPDGIKQQMKYPKFLYDVQSEMLMVYHNVKEDVLYRNNDIWALTKYGTTSTKSKVATLEPYYAMIKTPDNDKSELGLIQMYTQNGKSNITSYLVGSCNGTECELKIYKYPTDSNILGPIQLDNQIDQDETISAELATINVTGSKISKDMKIIPINNTVLYVETIYQTMANEPNQPITLKKVIVASGTKVAIGNTLEEAISNLLSQSAVNIEITNTEDVDGMIQAIINANKNLTESNDRNDWEMMGSDLKELQSLIDSLDKMIKENNKKAQ